MSPREPWPVLPGLQDAHAPAFEEPWQAQAFAIAVHLNEQGLFTWSEWAQVFSRELATAAGSGAETKTEANTSTQYFVCWLQALEKMLTARNIARPNAVATLAEAWQRAASATPHGQPITLENGPQKG